MSYKFFWDGPFSNWYPAKFIYEGHAFCNSEQAFMWEKAMFFDDKMTAARILNEPRPREVKNLGREVQGYVDAEWAKVRVEYMYHVCLAKFTQNEKLRYELLKYDNYVEASPKDRLWGIGMKEGTPGIEDPRNWKGQNLLGQVLNRVREAIK